MKFGNDVNNSVGFLFLHKDTTYYIKLRSQLIGLLSSVVIILICIWLDASIHTVSWPLLFGIQSVSIKTGPGGFYVNHWYKWTKQTNDAPKLKFDL